MTDAHFHRGGYATFLRANGQEVSFLGIHPWQTEATADLDALRTQLRTAPAAGVGEIGLDRLRTKAIPARQRELFARQLEMAADLRRPVVLHGAKCWGEVVAACRPFRGRIPAFLFHGFSRSAGLLPDIFSLNGYVSVGPALLNDHAVNYRALVKALPPERTLIETDMDYAADGEGAARMLRALRDALAALQGVAPDALDARLSAAAGRFLQGLGRNPGTP